MFSYPMYYTSSRVVARLENLEKSGNLILPWKTWKNQGISLVRTVAFPRPPTVEVPCVYLQEKSETPPDISVFTTPINITA